MGWSGGGISLGLERYLGVGLKAGYILVIFDRGAKVRILYPINWELTKLGENVCCEGEKN